MARYKLLAGDFMGAPERRVDFFFRAFILPDPKHKWLPKNVSYSINQVKTLEQVTEHNQVKVLGAAGWGTAGALALGPIGLLAGLVLGGRGQTVVFAVEFTDGKRALIQTDQKGWKKVIAARFDS